jgi:KipI family sensor histidine kinase inhibitor
VRYLPRFLNMGDQGLVVEFSDIIAESVFAEVNSLHKELLQDLPLGVVELVPTYRSLLIVYDPLSTTCEELKGIVTRRIPNDLQQISGGRLIEIPVCYGGEYGPDLDELAAYCKLTVAEVIAEHTGRDYLIYMIGFTPGFPYLGGLSERIACPRLPNPRTLVPKGSVGIAETQTGIYPLDSPGGWRLIGRTPKQLFAPSQEEPFLLAAGDRLRFVPVSQKEYLQLEVSR